MKVLFLALGATRRRAVIEESAQVVSAGGSAMVLIETARPWRRETFPAGVEVVEVSRLEERHSPRRLETLFLYKGPRFLLYRVVGRGSLRPKARRASKAYERRVADRVHRRLFMPVYRRLWPHVRQETIERYVREAAPFDLFVVTDALSMPTAVQLLDRHTADSGAVPQVAYSVDLVAA